MAEEASSGSLNVVLVEPQIPPNTGNIARLCAATGTRLHLIRPLGFEITDRRVKRAGLDYWPHVDLRIHDSLQAFFENCNGRLHLFTKKQGPIYTSVSYRSSDYLVFGSETEGLPDWLLTRFASHCVRIPLFRTYVRSLNLASAVAVATYEALRQMGRLSQIE